MRLTKIRLNIFAISQSQRAVLQNQRQREYSHIENHDLYEAILYKHDNKFES